MSARLRDDVGSASVDTARTLAEAASRVNHGTRLVAAFVQQWP
jgi:hypothetical protein